MYRVLCDGLPIYDLRDEELVLIEPKVTLEVNKSGSFHFRMPPKHPQYDLPRKMRSCIQVFQEDVEIFNGRPTAIKTDFYNRKYIECEGQLAFLNDSVQRPHEYHNMTVRGYLETLIAAHNQQVDETKQFEVGIVTVKDSNDSLFRYTNYNSTMKEIKEDLVDDLGGFLRVRNYNGHRYLDYIEEYENTNTQTIEFGENLLDFTRNFDLTDLVTVIVPLGAKKEESTIKALEERVTIEGVNGGKDYLCNDEALKIYGWIERTVTWNDVTTPEMLKSKGAKWLKENQFDDMVIEAKAIDLHYTDEQIEQFKLGDRIRIHSSLHGIDKYFPLTKMTICLNNLASNTITLGLTAKASLTATTSSVSGTANNANNSIPVPSAIVKQAVDQATALITAATHGHVVTTANEQLIMDTNDVNTATRVWRWNLNGLGYSSDGYMGSYKTAITMDGQIVGERLVGGSVSAEKIDITYRNSVEKEIADAELNATDAANGYTDENLKKYYTKSEIETTIQNTKDNILLSAKETATQYVDGQLKNYSTSAQIKVKTDAIESEVSKKLNSTDLSTKIQQSASAVKIAWNNISKYIQFEEGELRIYDSSVESTQKLVSTFNYAGNHFYNKGTYIGKIGTNQWAGVSTYKGLVFDLEYDGSYMCWAARENRNDSDYQVKMIYHHKVLNRNPGLYFECNTFTNGYLFLANDVQVIEFSNGGCGVRGGKMVWCDGSNTSAVTIDGNRKRMEVSNNVLVDFYSDINMHGWGINNQSDARMKENIQDCSINALELLNKIDLKEYDWIQSGEHEPIGIVAQQLQEFAPELVKEGKDGHLSIKTLKFVFYLIKAIQELTVDRGYRKAHWTDPFTSLEKKSFCAKLNQGNKRNQEKVHEPILIPIERGIEL